MKAEERSMRGPTSPWKENQKQLSLDRLQGRRNVERLAAYKRKRDEYDRMMFAINSALETMEYGYD